MSRHVLSRYQLLTIFLLFTANDRYEPDARDGHRTICVGSNVYMWAGGVDGMPEVHDSNEKRRFLSCVEVFHSERGDWTRQPTSGAPPLGRWVDMAVLQWVMYSTSLVVTVNMITAIITVFTH